MDAHAITELARAWFVISQYEYVSPRISNLMDAFREELEAHKNELKLKNMGSGEEGVLIDTSINAEIGYESKAASVMTKFGQPLTMANAQAPLKEAISVVLDGGVIAHIDKALLKENSGYFSAISETQMLEKDRSCFSLPEFTAENWEVFTTWLFRRHDGQLPMQQLINSILPESADLAAIKAGQLDCLAEAWLMGEFIIAPAFQNDLIERLVDLYYSYVHECKSIPVEHMQHVADSTFEASKLRSLVCDIIKRAQYIGHLTLTEGVEELLQSLGLQDILNKLKANQPSCPPMTSDFNCAMVYRFYRVERRGLESYRDNEYRDELRPDSCRLSVTRWKRMEV